MSHDRPVSTRSTLERAELEARLIALEIQNDSLRESVLGLGALVAQAVARGFIVAAAPLPPDHSVGRLISGRSHPPASMGASTVTVPAFTASDPAALERAQR